MYPHHSCLCLCWRGGSFQWQIPFLPPSNSPWSTLRNGAAPRQTSGDRRQAPLLEMTSSMTVERCGYDKQAMTNDNGDVIFCL